MKTVVPTVPELGVGTDTVGGPEGTVTVKPFVSVPVWESGFVTTTFHGPVDEPEGMEIVPESVVPDPKTTDVAWISVLPDRSLNDAPLTKPVPYTVTGKLVPRVPEAGLVLMTVGALVETVIGWVTLLVAPVEFVTIRLTVYDPELPKTCVGFCVVEVPPSPNAQLYPTGDPVDWSVNWTTSGGVPDEGLLEKAACTVLVDIGP